MIIPTFTDELLAIWRSALAAGLRLGTGLEVAIGLKTGEGVEVTVPLAATARLCAARYGPMTAAEVAATMRETFLTVLMRAMRREERAGAEGGGGVTDGCRDAPAADGAPAL